jgi:uncharacterized protein (TIGR00369 family)
MNTELSEDQQRRVELALTQVPFADLLRLKLDQVAPGKATMSVEIRDELRQNNGVVHGGAIASLIDSTTAFAIIPLLEQSETVTTVDLTITYIRPLVNGTVTCSAKVLRAGGRVIALAAEVFDAAGNLAASALTTYLRLKSPPKA